MIKKVTGQRDDAVQKPQRVTVWNQEWKCEFNLHVYRIFHAVCIAIVCANMPMDIIDQYDSSNHKRLTFVLFYLWISLRRKAEVPVSTGYNVMNLRGCQSRASGVGFLISNGDLFWLEKNPSAAKWMVVMAMMPSAGWENIISWVLIKFTDYCSPAQTRVQTLHAFLPWLEFRQVRRVWSNILAAGVFRIGLSKIPSVIF